MKRIIEILAMLAIMSIATSAMGETVDEADDCTGDQSITTCATIEDIKGIEVDFNALNFKKIIPGTESTIQANNIFNSKDGKPTIRNIGNFNISIKINATDLKNGKEYIPSSSLFVKIPGLSEKLDLGSEVTISNLAPNIPYPIIFSINAPLKIAKPGNYKGSISIKI